MDVVQGPAQRLRLSTEVHGVGDNVATSHVATLLIGRQPMRMEMPQSVMVTEGDRLAVAGTPGGDGVFTVYAYRNLETGAGGRAVGPAALVCGLIGGAIGVGAAIVALAGLLGLFGDAAPVRLGSAAFAGLFCFLFGRGGLLGLQLHARTRQAVAALDRQAAPRPSH
ncbi:MAG: hypothetical protein KBC73_20595 [Burkholderiaceae bacterium]|nr:hypothetical protein [Burkholderiaceae bacterium]